jgi:hypothetical protein
MKTSIVVALTALLFLGAGCKPITQERISGKVHMRADGFALMTDDNTQYRLHGGNFTNVIFQKITVVGAVTQDAEGKIIEVSSYEPES